MMPARKPRPKDEKPQFERFLETVKKVGAGETDEALERAIQKIAPPKKDNHKGRDFHIERKEDGRMSFRKYIAEMKLPRTRFAIDAQEDKDLPDAKTWEELEAYLVAQHCPQEVIADAAEVWRNYEDSIGLER